MKKKIQAGFIQFRPLLGDTESNMKKLSRMISQCREADLMVIPELANSGYNFTSGDQALELAEEINRSSFIEFLIAEAAEKNIFIVAGMNEKDGHDLFNTAVLICPQRGLRGKYRKIHLFMDEKDIFKPGNLGLPLFDIGICRLGMLICFDWIFPEVWRILALKGADVICHPSNLVLPFAQQAVPVHGMVNRTFVITANRIGTEREITFSGESIISDPLGKTLAKASSDREEVLFTWLDIGMARDKMITRRNHAFDDRMPEEYLPLIDPGKN